VAEDHPVKVLTKPFTEEELKEALAAEEVRGAAADA
jgi:hypothetical protein